MNLRISGFRLNNSVAGLAGGYITAWTGGRAPILHGLFLAAVQLQYQQQTRSTS